MVEYCIFLSHWYGGDLPNTLDLDTEICNENIRLSNVGPTVALQAGNKNEYYVSDLSHVCPIFSLALRPKIINDKIEA